MNTKPDMAFIVQADQPVAAGLAGQRHLRREPGVGTVLIGTPPQASQPGLFTAIGEALDAWCQTVAELRGLAAKRRLIESRRAVAAAEYAAICEVAALARNAEQAQYDLGAWQRIANSAGDDQLAVLRHEIEVEQLLSERQRHKDQREYRLFEPPAAGRPEPPAIPISPEPSMEPHVSSETIEQIATKAAIRFGTLTGPAAETAWQQWRELLRTKYPDFACREIERRAFELRQLSENW